MPRPRCLTCDNVGQVTEFRLVWLRRGLEGEPPTKCSRRLETEREGIDRIAELAENEYDAQILSAARACPNCRVGRESTPSAKRVEPVKQELPPAVWSAGEWPAQRDWKMAAAGDRED